MSFDVKFKVHNLIEGSSIMDKEKKKKIAKEAGKAAGVAGASAAIGAAYFAPDDTFWALNDYLGVDGSPLNRYINVMHITPFTQAQV